MVNETKTLTLSEFLRDRLKEREEAAKLAGEYVLFVCGDGHIEEPVREELQHTFGHGGYERWDDGEYRLPNHHNTWHPLLDTTQVLEDIMSKRAIMDLHEPGDDWLCSTCCGEPYREEYWDGETETTEWKRADLAYPCPTLRLLAAPYRRHELFREEWA